MPALIGIGGALAAGKDTVADHLVAKHGWKKHWMSEPLNDALLTLNPVIEIDNDHFKVRYARLVSEVGYTAAKEHPEVRRLLQVLGTEVGRNMIGEDTWVDIAGRKIDDSRLAERRDVIITGVRFKNELTMIKQRGGILLYVDRPGRSSTVHAAHASENSLTKDDFDVVVDNIGTLENLYDIVDMEIGTWSSRAALNSRQRDLELDIWPSYDH
jgi:hypothetical protein